MYHLITIIPFIRPWSSRALTWQPRLSKTTRIAAMREENERCRGFLIGFLQMRRFPSALYSYSITMHLSLKSNDYDVSEVTFEMKITAGNINTDITRSYNFIKFI